MGHRSWIVETDKEHYETTKQISTEYGSFDIVGAAVVKESLKDIEKGTYFEPNDIVLLLHSSGNHVIKEHPEVFNREFCLLDDIHYLRTDNGGTVAELEYLKEKEFLELIDPNW
jgi:hypothetical protein